MELNRAIKTRKSVRKFNDRKPNWRDIIECVDAARYAPMSGGNFSLKFIIVDNKNKIQKIADATEQDFVGQAQFVVVVCSNPLRTINAFGERGKAYLKQQAGAAIQNFLLKIQEKKLATCWVGHFKESPIKRELRIPEGVEIEAILPVGYEKGGTKTKEKIDMDNILYFNLYKETRMKPLKKFNV